MGFVEAEFKGVHVEGPEGFAAAIFSLSEPPNRILPIWLPTEDAAEIDLRSRGYQTKRPSTHDVLADTFLRLTSGGRAVRINSQFEGVFIAALVTNDGEEVDMKPSDALVVSMILELPIEIDEDVFMQSSVFVSDADLSRLFGINVEKPDSDTEKHASASGDAQADADFEELMQSMGVFETDLLGEEKEQDDED